VNEQGGNRARRPDSRTAKTIDKIVSAAVTVMLTEGTPRVSARQVCEEAGVSRGTLYRYFSSMDDILQAVASHLRRQTDEELRAAVEGVDDPTERFAAFLAYTSVNRETDQGAHFLHVEPAFVLRYFQSNFDHFIARVNDALGPVYDAWEKELGGPLDRTAVSEVMVRYALSATLVHPRAGETPLPTRLMAMADLVLGPRRAKARRED
jgi:AcrR family transcriptional regulator